MVRKSNIIIIGHMYQLWIMFLYIFMQYTIYNLQIYKWNHIVLMSTCTNYSMRLHDSRHSIINGLLKRGSIILNVTHILSMTENSLIRYSKLTMIHSYFRKLLYLVCKLIIEMIFSVSQFFYLYTYIYDG